MEKEIKSRKSIFEILEEQYDFNKEFQKISYLFNCNMVNRIGYGYPIEWFVNKIFHDWKARGSCINCADMRRELEIDTITKLEKPSFDQIILCLEYYVNILFVFVKKCFPLPKEFKTSNDLLMLQRNINILIEHMNFTRHIVAEEEKIILIPNNPAAISVAETAPKNIAFAILKYNHASLNGQLEEKRKLLHSIANEYEALLDNPTNGFSEYFKTVRGLLNNLNIRHNNNDGKNQNNLIKNMSPQELENNYDELYQLLLFCILTKDNSNRKKVADELLKKIKDSATVNPKV